MEVAEQQVVESTQRPFLRGYRLGSGLLALYFVALLPLYLVENTDGMGSSVAALTGVCAAILGGVHLLLSRHWFLPAQASLVGLICAGAVLGQILGHVILRGDLGLTSDLMLVLVGAAIVFPNRGYYYLTLSVTLATWAVSALVLSRQSTHAVLIHWCIGVVSATLVSSIIHTIFITVLTAQQQLRADGLRREREKEALIAELNKALENVRTLRGLLPICASCKQIRDEAGTWHPIERYVYRHSEASFTHSLCPECEAELLRAAPP